MGLSWTLGRLNLPQLWAYTQLWAYSLQLGLILLYAHLLDFLPPLQLPWLL